MNQNTSTQVVEIRMALSSSSFLVEAFLCGGNNLLTALSKAYIIIIFWLAKEENHSIFSTWRNIVANLHHSDIIILNCDII